MQNYICLICYEGIFLFEKQSLPQNLSEHEIAISFMEKLNEKKKMFFFLEFHQSIFKINIEKNQTSKKIMYKLFLCWLLSNHLNDLYVNLLDSLNKFSTNISKICEMMDFCSFGWIINYKCRNFELIFCADPDLAEPMGALGRMKRVSIF